MMEKIKAKIKKINWKIEDLNDLELEKKIKEEKAQINVYLCIMFLAIPLIFVAMIQPDKPMQISLVALGIGFFGINAAFVAMSNGLFYALRGEKRLRAMKKQIQQEGLYAKAA